MTDFDWDTFETELDMDEYSNLSLDSLFDDEVEEAPKPSELHISTITATARIVSKDKSGNIILGADDLLPINLQKLYENIPVDKIFANEDDLITVENGPVLGIEYVDNKPRGYDRHNKRRKKKRKTVKKKRNKFYNQSTLLIRMDDGHKINLKLFRNGGVQMTGLKYEEEGIKCITDIIIPILNELGERVIDKHFINDGNKLYIDKYDIVMINSNYSTNFKIKREVLHNILNKEYGILASFEPCIYPGVNAKYYWNMGTSNKKSGVCNCESKCVGKGRGEGDGDCKKITISTFQSGSVIITGARNTTQIYDAYNFINDVFHNHYSELKKREITITVPEPPVFKAKKKVKYTIKKIKKKNK